MSPTQVSPLLRAQCGRSSALRKFLRAQSLQNVIDKALLTAVNSPKREAARILFANGADINVENSNGDDTIRYVCS